MNLALLSLVTVLVVTACGDDGDTVGGGVPTVAGTTTPTGPTAVPPGGGTETATTASQPTDDWPLTPPPVVFESGSLSREPFTVCWSQTAPSDPNEEYESYCADGAPERHPPLVEPIDGRVAFTFPVDGWSFSANYLEGGAVAVEQVGDITWELVMPADAPGGIVIVSGLGPQGDVHVAITLPGGAPTDVAGACVGAIASLRQGLPAYDYEPVSDLTAVIDRSDAVVVGVIDAVRDADGRVEFSLADAMTWGGTEAVERVQTSGTLIDARSVDALSGVRAIAFVHRLDDGGFGIDIQGFVVQCPGGINQILEPLPDDPRLEELRGIDDLVSFVRQRKAPVREVTTDIWSVRLEQTDDFGVGETVPVQLWWTCGAGLAVPIDDEQYLPIDVGGLIRPLDRPWERADFPTEWEVVIVNQAPVDGADWVMLDAIAERLDRDMIEVRHVGTDTVVGAFTRDLAPRDERPLCG